ncbi:MAG: twin-arginine translocation signal domain-containing protein, partial [Porphyromonadaceae bacterium]|nr:twin-arginine translocation signal domain-containing protein [Porphyromonadaceae bacterium]
MRRSKLTPLNKLSENHSSDNSRRSFLKKATAATFTIAGSAIIPSTPSLSQSPISGKSEENIPWFRKITRWGQTNITEKDPIIYDIEWWRQHWKNTQVQGVIINAGGIVAYYPTKIPLHYKAQYLGDRDLFGDLCKAAHKDGLVVFARMDSNRANEEFYKAHPDWFAIDKDGK